MAKKTLLQEFVTIIENRGDFIASKMEKPLMDAKMKDDSARELQTVNDLTDYICDKISEKHVVWLAKMYAKGQFKIEDAARIKSEIDLFEKVKSKLSNKDLNTYATLGELYDATEPYQEAIPLSKSQQAAEIKKSETTVFYDSPDLKVIIPKTEAAACTYGAGTKWCTSATGEGNNMFAHYNDKGPLYILLADIDGKKRKFQLHYETNSFKDERDQDLSAKDIKALSALPDYKEFLNKLIELHYGKHIPK